MTPSRARAVVRNALLGAIVAAVVLSLLYVAAELVLRSRDGSGLAVNRKYPKGYFMHDAFGMAKPRPGEWHVVTTSTDTGKVVYDVRYTVDQFGRRVTPVSDSEGRDRFALFFGCSYAYGEGLQDDETLARDFAAIARRYRPYNYAFHGGGPFEALARMEHVPFDVEVPEKSGIGVYLYIDDHVRRVNNFSTVARWHSDEIYYAPDAGGRFVSDGSFAQARPWETRLRVFVSNQRVLNYLGLHLPLRVASKHLDLTTLALAEVARRFKLRFPGSEFYVAIYPGMVWSEPIGKRLARHGVRVLDYSKLFDRNTPGYRIETDGHPTAAAIRELAAALAHDVEREDAPHAGVTAAAPSAARAD